MTNQNKNIQLIFCLETCSTAKTDQMYLIELIKRFYPAIIESSYVKREYVFLSGKSNYNNHKIRKDINKRVKEYKDTIGGQTVIVYLLDKDKFDSVPEDRDFIIEVDNYCTDNGFELIWFVRNIEHVLLGQKIESNKKVIIASRFKSSQSINGVDKAKLSCIVPNRNESSNFIVIMDKIISEFS